MSLSSANLERLKGRVSVRHQRNGIPVGSIVWETADGDTDISIANIGFIAHHATNTTVDVKMKLREDDDADIVTVNVGQQYAGDVKQIVADGTTATKIVVRV